MTLEIALVYLILLGALVLFLTEWVRMDVTALLVLLAVGLSGLVSPGEAISGFSNPAVITVWAMFIISGGLTLTGVADLLGQRLVRVAGEEEVGLIVGIMLTAAILSAFMNNVGVAAMMLPVVIQIGRQTGHPPSRLLMPLSLGCLLGGLTTLIGTPPNILVADQLREYGLRPFSLFEFTPIGGAILVAGIAFVTLVGRHLLPRRDPMAEEAGAHRDPGSIYALGERLYTIRLAPDSPLDGRTLEESRIGAALGLNVVALVRGERTEPAPPSSTKLRSGDRLLALGRTDRLGAARDGRVLVEDDTPDAAVEQMLRALDPVEARVTPDSPLLGQRLFRANLRERHGARILALRRGEEILDRDVPDLRPEPGDALLLLVPPEKREAVREALGIDGFEQPLAPEAFRRLYALPRNLVTLRVPEGSVLAGNTLRRARLREVLGVDVWAIEREGRTLVMPGPDDTLEAGDRLLLRGTPRELEALLALRKLTVESHPLSSLDALQSRKVGVAEVILAPETSLAGRTPRDLDFRNRYGLTILALWKKGTARRTELRDLPLQLGDGILVQ